MTRLVTTRLVIETLTADEAAAIRAGDRAGRSWADDYPTEGDIVVASVICEAGEHYDESSPLGVYQVRLAATGEAVGGIGFLSAPLDGEAEIGYGVAESVRGRGLATEAVRELLAHAGRLGVRQVVALTDPDNAASRRVLERVGFQPTGEVVTHDGQMLGWVLVLVGVDAVN